MFGYFRARFPILPLYLYTFLTVKAIAVRFGVGAAAPVVIVAFVYLEFLFHLRVLDEFKDYYYDSAHHKDRPVQKGEVSLDRLRRLGVINVLVMLWFMDYGAPLGVVIVFMTGLIYTLLMFYEFFLGAYLRKRIGLYMVSHQLVFIPIFLSFYGVFSEKVWIPGSLADISHFIYLVLPIAILEIGRKLKPRLTADGSETDDTYNYHWGEKRSVEVFCLLVITTCCFGVVAVMETFVMTDSYLLASLSIIVLILGFFSLFRRPILVAYNMAFTVFIVLILPLLAVFF